MFLLSSLVYTAKDETESKFVPGYVTFLLITLIGLLNSSLVGFWGGLFNLNISCWRRLDATDDSTIGSWVSKDKMQQGLSAHEATRRLGVVGPNILDLKKPTILGSIVREFSKPFYLYQNFMVWYVCPDQCFSSTCITLISFLSLTQKDLGPILGKWTCMFHRQISISTSTTFLYPMNPYYSF